METAEPQPTGDDVNEPQKEKLPTPKEMHVIFHMMVNARGGLKVTQKLLDEYPEDCRVDVGYDEDEEVWSLWVEQEDDEPKIILPGPVKPKKRRRQLIRLPSAGDRRKMFGS